MFIDRQHPGWQRRREGAESLEHVTPAGFKTHHVASRYYDFKTCAQNEKSSHKSRVILWASELLINKKSTRTSAN